MATTLNDRDVLLQSASARATAGGRYLALAVSTPVFHVATDGTPFPTTITIQATPVNIAGAVASFAVSPVGSATLSGTGNTRTLAFSSMSLDNVTVTATVTDNGQMYTASQVISKVEDGAAGRDGTNGTNGTQYATSYLYKWSSTQPALPNGTATFTWASGANTSYSGTDSWNTSVPTNPGTAGVQLWVAQKQVSAASGTVTTNVTYSAGAVLSAISQNGATGPQGAPGVKTVRAVAYQWANGPAPTATGSATYTWATGDYNTVPATGWTKTKPNAPSTGYTLYEASVLLVDSSGASTTSIDWSTASISGISYVGTDGSTGSAGSSATIAYTLIDGSSLNTTPATFTASGTNLPTTGTWGETRAWSTTVPTAAAGQSVFQSNGIYNPVANNTVWGIPYMSNFRVGNLSALSTNTGSLTVSGTVSSANGNFTVDSNGNAAMKSITIKDASGNTILSSGTALNPAYAAAGTLNSAITLASNGTLSGAGGGAVTITGLGYTGDMNATNGATIGANLFGQMTSANIGTYIANAAIGDALIGNLSANKITTGTLTGLLIQTATAGSSSRISLNESSNNRLIVYGDGGSGYGTLIDMGYTGATSPLLTVGNFVASATAPAIRAYTGSGIGVDARSTSNQAVYAESTSGYAVFAITTSGSSAVFGQSSTREAITGTTAGTGYAGVYGSSSNGIGVGASGATYDFYAGGLGTNYGPFTGAHDGLISKEITPPVVGDIMVDVRVVRRANVSNTITAIELSSKPCQKNVIGVFVKSVELISARPPAGLTDNDTHIDIEGPPREGNPCSDFDEIADTYDRSIVNALGEGQINVCGEGGDIEAGDYITTSSIPGKGMRQADDILRNYTVAKARESVTFSSPDEVKMIACTYHCG